MENRENWYSREDFEEFLIRRILWSNLYKKRLHRKSFDFFWWMYIVPIAHICLAIPVYIFFSFMATIINSPNYTNSEFWIFIISQSTALVVLFATLIYACLSFFKISVYKKTLNYFHLKDKILLGRDKFEIILKQDIKEFWVNINLIEDIKENISYILLWYKIILKSHQYIQSHIHYFGRVPKKWKDIINAEFKWIVDYSQEFTLLVQYWISHHAVELAELEKQIELQEFSTENTGWKAALGLQRLSLQGHLRELERVKG